MRMLLSLTASCCILLAVLVWSPPLQAQEVGEDVILHSPNPDGVPVHPAAGDNSYWRWPNESEGFVVAIDAETSWLEINVGGTLGWVTPRYVTVHDPDLDPVVPGTESELLSYVIGTWNLEHFRHGIERGFPESTHGGPSYQPRSSAEVELIASTIRDALDAKILILNEINGMPGQKRSEELEDLLGFLGDTWTYELTEAGHSHRLAILFDSSAARRNRCHEIPVPEQRLDDKDVFDRDPLTCWFTLLGPGGVPQNDLVVVALHLASGQKNNANHNRAMAILADSLSGLFSAGIYPAGETDILIGGDLNASRYDSKQEDFWDGYTAGALSFRTLAPEDAEHYHGTRLAGVPLHPHSQIDYLIATSASGGLVDDLTMGEGHVHLELLPNDFTTFRQQQSDHIPVTVRIRVKTDDDSNVN